MLRWIWDFLFTRRQWKIIKQGGLRDEFGATGTRYVLQDQWGNIKRKDIIA